MASPDFARYWSDYRLFEHQHGRQQFAHPSAGPLTLNYETLHLPGPDGLAIATWTADPGSPSADTLRRLGALTASAVRAGCPTSTRPADQYIR